MTMTTQSDLIKLNDVKIAFPNIFQKKVWPNSEREAKYECIFLLDKEIHKKEIELINNQIESLSDTNKLNKSRIKSCIHDGDLHQREEYHAHYTISAKSKDRFPIVNKDGKTPITPDENPFYGGCIVSAYINLYVYTKPMAGVGANIKSIQFRKEGTPFNNFIQNIEGAFEPIEGEEGNEKEEDLF